MVMTMRRAVVGVLCVTALLFGACQDSDTDPERTAPATVLASATPARTSISRFLPEERDPHEVLSHLQVPDLNELVRVAEGGLHAALLARLPQVSMSCEEFIVRGADGCQLYQLPPGTTLTFVQLLRDSPAGSRLLAQAREYLEEHLPAGSKLEFIARREDGLLVLLFDHPSPGLALFRIEYDPASQEVVAAEGHSGINPLDFIRVDHHRKAHQWTVLAAADSFHAKELAWKEELERSNTAFPPDYN
jgi:hypothetical protein